MVSSASTCSNTNGTGLGGYSQPLPSTPFRLMRPDHPPSARAITEAAREDAGPAVVPRTATQVAAHQIGRMGDRERRVASVAAQGGLQDHHLPRRRWRGTTMAELLVDFITSLDGYASGEGWPGFWGLEGPEYLAWLGEQPEVTYLMGANTYRLMSGFAAGEVPNGQDEFRAEEKASVDGLTQASKVVFSSSLEEPLAWANSTLVRDDAVEAVRAMKKNGTGLLSTIGSLSLCRSLLKAGLVDRFRVGMFPVITGATGAERIYDGYPDVALEMIEHRTFDGRIQLVEYKPRVLEHPPLGGKADLESIEGSSDRSSQDTRDGGSAADES
jgi:dihydrofolate reductase